MACSRPVVASAVGGMLDTVIDGVTGVHVPPRDPRRLTAVMRSLLTDPGRREAMGRAGLERAVQRYSWPRIAADTESIYAWLASRSGVRPYARRLEHE
jgi:glycosyltransferase involved in cell wall biosynthesis